MADQNLINYIRQSLAEGFSREKIFSALLAAGWRAEQIKEALEFLSPQSLSGDIVKEAEAPGGITPFLKSKYLYILIICFIGLAGLGVGAYGYFFPSPEKVIEQAIQNMATEINSIEYSFSLNFGNEWTGAGKAVSFFGKNFFGAVATIVGESQELAALPINSSARSGQTLFSIGKLDFSDRNDQKIEAMFEIGGMKYLGLSLRLDFKRIGKDIFIKLNNLPGLEQQLNGLGEQWFRFNEQDIQEAAKILGVDEILEEYKKEVGAQNREYELSAEQEERLMNLAKETQFLSVKEKMPDEILYEEGGETKTFHYVIGFNEAGIKKYISDGFVIMKMEKQYGEIKREIENGIAELTKARTEIWIGKKDRLLHKASVSFKDKGEGSVGKEYASASLSLFNFNKPAEIREPSEFKTAKDLALIYLGAMEKAREQARDARRQSDAHQIALAMEMYFDSHNATYPNLPDVAAPIPADAKILKDFFSGMPQDPMNQGEYMYFWTDAGRPKQGYCVWTKLENQEKGQYALSNAKGYALTNTPPTKENCFSL